MQLKVPCDSAKKIRTPDVATLPCQRPRRWHGNAAPSGLCHPAAWDRAIVVLRCLHTASSSRDSPPFVNRVSRPAMNRDTWPPAEWTCVIMTPCPISALHGWRHRMTKKQSYSTPRGDLNNRVLLHWREKLKRSKCLLFK